MPTIDQPFALPSHLVLPTQDVHIVRTAQAPPAPPQTASPAIAGGDANAQIASLATQLAGLELQRVDVLGRLRSGDAATRAAARGQLAGLDAQVSQVKAAIKDASNSLARQQQPVIITPSMPDWMIHNSRNSSLFPLAALAMAFVILWPIGLGIGRRLSRRGAAVSPSTSPDTIAPRLDRMEQAIDAIAIEVERVSESQRFIAKVLA